MTVSRIAAITASYCLANVALMLGFAWSLIGPMPFWLIHLLIIISFFGASLIPPFLATKSRWLAALACALALGAAGRFDVWCLHAASVAAGTAARSYC